jgi:hypothetical protein
MEQRLNTMLQAIKIVQPALGGFLWLPHRRAEGTLQPAGRTAKLTTTVGWEISMNGKRALAVLSAVTALGVLCSVRRHGLGTIITAEAAM